MNTDLSGTLLFSINKINKIMKKNLMIACFCLSFGISASAQKIKESEVPAAVKASFSKQYPGITAKWEKEDGNFEAGFKKDSKEMSAIYQANGMMMESELSIKESELPAAVLNYVKVNYKDKKIKESAKITKADGSINYEAEVDGKDLIFDSKGNFVGVSKD